MRFNITIIALLAVATAAFAQKNEGWGEDPSSQQYTCNAGHAQCQTTHTKCSQGHWDCGDSHAQQQTCAVCGQANCTTDHGQGQTGQGTNEQERAIAEAEIQRWKEAYEREHEARSKEQRDYAAWERQRCESRINSSIGRRVNSIKRAKSSGDTAKLQSELNRLKAWKDAVDKNGQLKRAVSWFSKQRMKDLEAIIGSKEQIAWLKDAVGTRDEQGNFTGDLPTMLDDWRKLKGKGHTLDDLHDEVYGNGDKIGLRAGLDVNTAVLEEMAQRQGTTVEQLLKDREARLNGEAGAEDEEGQPADYTWVWWAIGTLLGVVVLYGAYRLLRWLGGSGGGTMPAPTVASVTPNTGPLAGGTPLTVTGTSFNAGVMVGFRKAGRPSVAALNVALLRPTQLTCETPTFPEDGLWELVVRNTDGQEALTGFMVTP
jgi:hypothetical protein